MIQLDQYKNLYFVGIGGIGMSALARYFHDRNKKIGGYDKTSTELTRALENEGVSVCYEDNIALIPEAFNDVARTLVVYTPAIPSNHSILEYFRSNNYQVLKRAEVLGILTRHHFTIAVAGTHGKTTTSSIITQLLVHAGIPCTAFVGGICLNFQSNLLVSKKQDAVFIVEADEYDRSFLHIKPDIAVVTALDPDHLDIYQTRSSFVEAFQSFINGIKNNGKIIHKYGLDLKYDTLIQAKNIQVESYGLEAGDCQALEPRAFEDSFLFDLHYQQKNIPIELHLPGYHNVENTLAAYLVAKHLQIEDSLIQEGIASYQGVKRRFEYIVKKPYCTYIDDYAHHPEELLKLLQSVRALYPGKKIVVIFQPHLYSRTKDFAPEFAKSLSLADGVILLDIYPAREEAIPGVSSALIYDQLIIKEKYLLQKEKLMLNLKNISFDVLLTAGAGDIDQMVDKIKTWLENEKIESKKMV